MFKLFYISRLTNIDCILQEQSSKQIQPRSSNQNYMFVVVQLAFVFTFANKICLQSLHRCLHLTALQETRIFLPASMRMLRWLAKISAQDFSKTHFTLCLQFCF